MTAQHEPSATAKPVAEPTPEAPQAAATPEADAPAPQDNELRCTLCGLRACWTA